MNYFTIITCILLFTLFLYLLRHYYSSILSPSFIISVFIIKIVAGFVYGWIHLHYYNGGDTYSFLAYSKLLYQGLHKNPLDFLRLVFGPISSSPAYMQKCFAQRDFPTDAGTYLMIRYNLLLLPITKGIYNVHVVIYEFINVWGLIFLYRFFLPYLRGKELLLKALIFFLPSILFWCSGIHKDGFTLTGLALLLYGTDSLLQGKLRLNYFIHTTLGAFLLLFAHDFLFFLIIPCIASYAICRWFPKYPVIKWLLVHTVFFIVAFNINDFYYSKQANQHYDLLGYLMYKQNDFIDLTLSRANLPVPRLQHNYINLLSSIPYALNHCLFRPYIFELTSVIQYPSAIENLFIIIAIISALLLFSLKKINVNLLLFLLFYCFTQFVLMGITVTNVGALVRYRAIGILLFLIALLMLVDKEKLAKIISKIPLLGNK